MPADIRSFFGGKPNSTLKQETNNGTGSKPTAATKRKTKSRMVVEDDSDDDASIQPKIATPKKGVSKKVKTESPKGIETTSEDYFASSKASNASKATPVKTKPRSATRRSRSSPRSSSKAADTSSRASARKVVKNSYADNDDEDAFLDDDADAGDDIFAAESKRSGRRKDDNYLEIDSDEPVDQPKKISIRARQASRHRQEDVDMKDVDPEDSFVVPEDDEEIILDKPAKNSSVSNASRKRKSALAINGDDDGSDTTATTKKVSRTNGSPKKPPSKKARATKEDVPESAAIQAIFDSIPTVRAPTPPPKDPNVKFDWRKAGGAAGGANAGPPLAAGAKEIPIGAENCLGGLTFVFTGLLETIVREDAQELVKRYGGKVTGAPSSKTSYVVLGSDAGPSKLEKIKKLNITTIDEDGLFALIRKMPANGGDSKNAEKQMEKKRAEEEKVKRDAEEMEREERRRVAAAEKEAQAVAAARGIAPSKSKSTSNSQLWTTKYAPTQMSQICGNKSQVAKIQKWLQAWQKNHKMGFQMRGADGTGAERAIIIHGPPGIGKTTAAHLAAKLEGYDVIESNASDTRSKKLVENGLHDVLNNSSLLGFFAGDGKVLDPSKKKIVLIMDEVDGMSAGDRGGVGALAKVCKKTDIPMILICNDRKSQKMKPFDHVAFDIPFRRPTVQEVRSRVATIAAREGLKLSVQVIDALIEGSNKDIRQIINMLSTAKLDQTAMDFDQGKSMSKAWEKHVVLKPWDICHKLLGGGMFANSSKATLNDKIELYFNDHEFSYLMIQENYLSTKPMLANDADSRKAQRLKWLELADKAAESISDGDLVDRMIHGSQQQWSLMPTHAVFSAVRPSSFMSGAMTERTAFTQWLGNNSKYGKLTRYVKEIQSHMRLRTSGDRHEIRQQYLPVLWEKIIKRLETEGKDSVPDVIELMDSYFLTRDDFDYMLELGLGEQREDNVKLETQTKAAFTRLYNQQSHPLPFMKANNVVAPQKAPNVAPDLEEALEEEDDAEIIIEEKDEDEDVDAAMKKDKYIKQPKVKKTAPPKKTPAGKKAVAPEDGEGEVSEDDVTPKPAKRAKGKAKSAGGKGKAKR